MKHETIPAVFRRLIAPLLVAVLLFTLGALATIGAVLTMLAVLMTAGHILWCRISEFTECLSPRTVGQITKRRA